MTFEELKNETAKIIETYGVAFKLMNVKYSLEIDERDSSIYDAWDWRSPCCYSFIIHMVNIKMKISINPRDLECVLEIRESQINNKDAKLLFNLLIDKYDKHDRNEADFSRCYIYEREHNVLAYIGNHEIFLQTLKDYFETLNKLWEGSSVGRALG